MSYDYEGVKKAITDLLIAVGEDPNREGLVETPDRVARAFEELLQGMWQEPQAHLKKQFQVEHDDLIIVKDIPFYSFCEHHILPFHGLAHICYVPENGKVAGLSKLARLVEGYASRLQVQERITGQIADALLQELKSAGVFVMLEAEHMCMTMRGIKKPNSKTVTTVARGILDTTSKREEIIKLIRSNN